MLIKRFQLGLRLVADITTLWAANQFSGCLATEQELQEWSGEIGSDASFSNGASYCTAFGWHLEEIHVTWAHLEKKRTRLRTYAKSLGKMALRAWRRRLEFL